MLRLKIMLKLFWANKWLILSGVGMAIAAKLFPNKWKWIAERKQFCDNCVYNSDNELFPNPMPWRKDSLCTLCSCNLFLKQHSPCSNCGMEKLPGAFLKWESICQKKE
jgi:hypothetical protein